MAIFKVANTFTVSSRNWFVLAGEVIRGEIEVGMEIELRDPKRQFHCIEEITGIEEIRYAERRPSAEAAVVIERELAILDELVLPDLSGQSFFVLWAEFSKVPPNDAETAEAFCQRLQAEGYDEMFMRKQLVKHYDMQWEQFAKFFERFSMARLRHIETLRDIEPGRTEYSLTLKVAKNLDLSRDAAAAWVKRYEEFEKG